MVALLQPSRARTRTWAGLALGGAGLLTGIAAEPLVDQSLTRLLGSVQEAFGMNRVALVEGDREVVSVGAASAGRPALSVQAADGLRLVAEGPPLFGEDRRLLDRL